MTAPTHAPTAAPIPAPEPKPPIYIVRNSAARDAAGKPLPPRLVRAKNEAQARNHVVNDTITVARATQDECIEFAAVKVEQAASGEGGAA